MLYLYKQIHYMNFCFALPVYFYEKTFTGSLFKTLIIMINFKISFLDLSCRALTLASNEVRFHIDSETHDPIDVETKQIRYRTYSL